MTCALAGLVSWREVPPLPFELACLPQSWYRFVRLPVVSYALPALIAIGQAIHHHRPPWNPIRGLRGWQQAEPAGAASDPADERRLPRSDAADELRGHERWLSPLAARPGRRSGDRQGRRVPGELGAPDGSWPIDTNLATWVTTLSVNALAAAGDLDALDRQGRIARVAAEAAVQRSGTRTPAPAPGGWAWTALARRRAGRRRHIWLGLGTATPQVLERVCE